MNQASLTTALELRTCTTCGKPFPATIDYFSCKSRSLSGRLTRKCRPCMSIYRKTYRKTNKQKIETKQKVYRATNRERISMRSKAHYAANKDKRIRQCRDASLMRKYGITPTEYNSMVELQHGLCAICKRRPRGSGREANLYVDHDHNTKRVRGLLCKACNCMLGFVLEDAVILTGCINYIEKYNKMAENNTTTEQRNTQCHAS